MQDFFKLVHPYKDRYRPVRVNQDYLKVAQDLTFELLQVRDLNAMRDRFEGVKFHNKILTMLFAQYAMEDLLNVPCVDIEKIRKRDFSNTLQINGKPLTLNGFTAEELPLIEADNNLPNVFLLKRNKTSGLICGFIDSETLTNPVNFRKTGIRREFVGFNNLQQFSSYSELENLISPYKVIS